MPAEKVSPRPVQPPPQALSPDNATLYSPWVKYCGTDDKNPQANPICLTVKEARLESGQFVSGAALIEQIGNEKKILRVSLPLGIRLIPGARVFIDNEPVEGARVFIDNEPVETVPPLQCMASICFTGFEVAAGFIAKLKQGHQLRLEGVDLPGYVATWPLMEFATAIDGPPTDLEQVRGRTAKAAGPIAEAQITHHSGPGQPRSVGRRR